MGVVYRAYHPELERVGAVKIMQAISPDPDTVTRFRHEAQAIAQLRHPNIVNVYDFGAFQGTPYMIVEYVAGGSLAARMSHGRLDQFTAIRYLRGIAAGLDYAHGHGIVHRDVKPANVLLTTEDTPVLADFGLAKLMQGSSLKSLTGFTTGTPAYMSPEQVAGHHVGPATDRYALATIAYEMLTGFIPFDGEALMEMLYAQVHREPPPPSSRLPDLGPAVDAVILRGLAKDPEARWGSAAEFVEELAAAMKIGSHVAVSAPVPAAPAFASTLPLATREERSSAVPMAATAVAELAIARPQPATVAMAFPEPAPAAAPTVAGTQISRLPKRQILIGLAALLVVLLAFGTCAVLAQATSVSVTPDRATRGETVTVKPTHVPANQVGDLQLWSIVHSFPFQADKNGNATIYMTVPDDVALGDHVVKVCWDNACHAQAPLKVVAGVAAVLPTPTPGLTPGPTPGATPMPSAPGSTPTPHSGGGGTTPRPTAPPTAPPSPTPLPNPCPGNANAPVLSPASQSILLSGGNATISGSNFTPNSTVTLSYYAPQNSATATQTWTVTVACNGTFPAQTFATKPTLVLRTDKVVACDVKKGCASATINIVL